MKKKKWFKYLNPNNLLTEIHRYGYHFSLTNYIEILFLAFIGLGGIGYLFGLKWNYIFIIMAVCLLLLPTIILSTYNNLYEQKKFIDASNYIEQLLYSFKRKSKILSALNDTLALFPKGQLHDAIIQTIHYIQTANTQGNLYEEAFQYIEKEYECQRISMVHRFLIKVETIGGSYEESAEILIEDRNRWVERVYEIQKEKQRIKRNMVIAIIFSFVIIGSTVLLLPKDFKNIIEGSVSQTVTTGVVIGNILLWIFVQCKLTGSWITEENIYANNNLRKCYMKVMYREEHQKKSKNLLGKMVVIGCIGVSTIVLRQAFLTVLLIVLGYLIISNPKRNYKKAKKKLAREVEKAFPEWMMSMALVLQSANAHVSLAATIPEAPLILREELRKVLSGIDANPNSVQPYISFFKELEIPDVESAMKMLYSVAEYGSENIGKQIAVLVQRNTVMMDKAERIKAEDYLAGMGFFVLTPMITGSAKMLVDMMLLIVNLLSFTPIS